MSQQTIKHHTSWGAFLFGAIMCGFIGWACLFLGRIEGVILCVFFAICSLVLQIRAIQSLITEANVKALEVFYGKERAIKPAATRTFSPGYID